MSKGKKFFPAMRQQENKTAAVTAPWSCWLLVLLL
jgi:hypothetical protein